MLFHPQMLLSLDCALALTSQHGIILTAIKLLEGSIVGPELGLVTDEQ
jgi:hypothetical protein